MPSATILVVEDDAPTRIAMTHLLQMEGYSVLGAANGKEALELIAEHHPVLVLSDVRMPVMGGEELVARLRELGGPPVILMTAHALVDAAAAATMGAVAVVHKPIDLDHMLGLIETTMGLVPA
ncbi:MAG: response regulator [Nannocystaceae bacterium]